jgi:hypothetical protein
LFEGPSDAGLGSFAGEATALSVFFDAITELGDAIEARSSIEDDASNDASFSLAEDHEVVAPEASVGVGANVVDAEVERLLEEATTWPVGWKCGACGLFSACSVLSEDGFDDGEGDGG